MSVPIIKASNISKSFSSGSRKVAALSGVNITLAHGEFVSIRGRSGSGKTTLLNILAGLEHPDKGQVVYSTSEKINVELNSLREPALSSFRLKYIGLVFQFFNLLPTLTLRQNIVIPGQIAKQSPAQIRDRLKLLTSILEIEHAIDRYPTEASGGERQRAAVARALFNKPPVILADEPTGNLDSQSAEGVFTLFRKVVEEDLASVLVVTHDKQLSELADRCVVLENGKLV